MDPTPGVARFDLETPTGSPTKADAAATPHFAPVELADNLATISLDSDVHTAAPPEQPAASGAAPAAKVTGQAPAAPTAPTSHSEGVVTAAAPPAATSSQPPPELPRASPVKVWVKDAEKVAGKLLASHISCLVRTECSKECALATQAAVAGAAAAGSAEEVTAGDSPSKRQQQPGPLDGLVVFEVRRRFDDLELLSRLLKGHFRGYFIPRLPPSEWLSGGDNYMRTRKIDLQDYLVQVVNHPVLQGSEELCLFLTAPGDLAACSRWQRMVQRPPAMDALLGFRRAEASSSSSTTTTTVPTSTSSSSNSAAADSAAPGGAGWGVTMMRMRQSFMHVVQHKAQPELSAVEQQLRQAKEWLKELQQHLSSCVEVVRSLMAHSEALCESYGELGRAMSHFARFEEALGSKQGQYTAAGSSAVERGADLQKLGYGALRQHSLSKQFVLSAGASLVFLPDYAALIPECVGALQEREDALEAVHLLSEQLQEKQEAAGKLAPGDKRAGPLAASVTALQDKLLAAEQQYKLLRDRNQAELARLDLQRAEDFRRCLGRVAALQAQAASAAAGIWQGVAEQFAAQPQAQGSVTS